MVYIATRYDTLASNCYALTDGKTAIVIDPSVSYDELVLQHPSLSNVKIEACLLTHAHADHFLEIESYNQKNIKIIVPEDEAKGLNDIFYNCSFMLRAKTHGYCGKYVTVSDGEFINTSIGDIKVIATPGHTQGSVCYLICDKLFSGDTVFQNGGYGRYDLPSGNLSELRESIKRLSMLDKSLTVYSGHGEVCTLGETLKYINI